MLKYRFYNDNNECPLACETRDLDFTTSTGEYPTRNYVKQTIALNPEYFGRIFNTTVDNITYEMVKNNFASVEIKYDKLSIRELRELPAVSGPNLISNLGGLLGIFIGPSFLTFMEIFEFTIVSGLLYLTIIVFKTNSPT